MAKKCLVCGKSILAGIEVSEGHVCSACWKKAGFDTSMGTIKNSKQYSVESIKERLDIKEKSVDLRNCLSCGKPMNSLANKVIVSDGNVCMSCWKKAGFDSSKKTLMLSEQYSSWDIKEKIIEREVNFKGKECLICGTSMGALSAKIILSDGKICTDCWEKAGFDNNMKTVMTSGDYYIADIKERIACRAGNTALITNFKATKKFELISFDDNTQTFVITKKNKKQDLYYYNQIVDFTLLEDGESVTKGGLGGAVAGGLLFGGVGAIVGGVTAKRKTTTKCNSLQIKITLRNSFIQTEYISLIEYPTPKNSFVYKNVYKTAQDILSALQLAVDIANPPRKEESIQVISGADEILKYKNLMDAGIITEEEFNAKKSQILGL